MESEIPTRNRFENSTNHYDNGNDWNDDDLEPNYEDLLFENSKPEPNNDIKKSPNKNDVNDEKQKKLYHENISHLRGRDLQLLNQPKRTKEVQFYYMILVTAICILIYYMRGEFFKIEILNEYWFKLESYITKYRIVFVIFEYANYGILTFLDMFVVSYLISKTKDPSLKHHEKLKQCYQKFIEITKCPDRESMTPIQSRLEKVKAQEVLGQYNKVLYPYRKKYLNIVGKYMYEIAFPNFICFLILMPMVIDYEQIFFRRRTYAREFFASLSWNLLVAMQISKLIVWINNN